MALTVSAHLDLNGFNSTTVEMGASFTLGGQVDLDPAADWNAQKMAYGREVAMAIADVVVPQLAAQFEGGRTSPVKGHLTASNSLKNVSGTDRVGRNVLMVREKVSGAFRIQVDRDMNVGDIIFAARDLIAMAVAQSAVFALEHRLEGKPTSDTSMSVDRKNGEIVAIGLTEAPEDGGGEKPASTPSRLLH